MAAGNMSFEIRHTSIFNTPSLVTTHEEDTESELEWFAIQVKCRYEERVASTLVDKGFEALSATMRPSKKTHRVGCGESRALFPGYIFGRFNVRQRLPILVTPGVQAIVGCGKRPVPVDGHEIAAIRQALDSGEFIEPCPYIGVGDSVEVIDGPLCGMHGILVQHRSSTRVVISVSLIQRSVRVEVAQAAVRPLNRVPQIGMQGGFEAGLRIRSCA